MNRIALILTAFFIVLGIHQVNAQNYLQKKIVLSASPQSVGDMLDSLEFKGGFYFSYNSNILDASKNLPQDITECTVEEALKQMFHDDLKWKVVGSHVILQKNKQAKQKTPEFSIQGKITDLDGQEIDNVIVYEVNRRKSIVSESDGRYQLKIKSKQVDCAISYSCPGYHDTLIIVKQLSDQQIDIILRPKVVPNEVLVKEVKQEQPLVDTIVQAPKKGDSLELPMQDFGIMHAFVPQEAMFVSEHLNVYEDRFFQISFLPFVGSNFLSAGLIHNNVSLNLLAGYSAGTRGVELGGLANVSKGSMFGLQMVGLTNIVGGNMYGLQMAGVANVNRVNTNGGQLAGLMNINIGKTNGLQMAGLTNFNVGKTNGLQMAGLINTVIKDFSGVQVAGLFNVANIIELQDSTIETKAKPQIQVAGLANYSKKVTGMQVSGLVNINRDTLRGLQASAIYNQCGVLNGLQVGLINYSDSIGHGLSVGIVNIIRSGYRSVQLGSNETFPYTLSVKSGGDHFYTFGKISFGHYTGFGLGLGTTSDADRRFSIYGDIVNQLIVGPTLYGTEVLGSLTSTQFGIQVRLFRRVGISGGPTFNNFFPSRFIFIYPQYEQSEEAFFGQENIYNSLVGFDAPWIGWHASLNIQF